MGALAVARPEFAEALASTLLHSLWQDTLLGVAAALTLGALSQRSAARRHGVALAFLAAMVVLPALQFLSFSASPGLPIERAFPWARIPEFGATIGVFGGDSASMAGVLVALWLLGVSWQLARHVAGLRRIAALERGSRATLPPALQQRAEELRRSLRIARAVVIRVSSDVLTPCAARLLRPVIWLPLSLVTQAPAEQLEALLAHELAHIARKDWLWNGVQCALESLLFFHPAARWLGRRIREEREQACDDLAVAACGDALALAEALAALGCERHPAPGLALAARGGSLLHRITRLLSGSPSRGRSAVLAAFGAVTVAGLLCLAQLDLNGGLSPDLWVRASTAGELGPGDFREITSNREGIRRFYRVSVDARGVQTEVFLEDGRTRPIDDEIRQWIREVEQPRAPEAFDAFEPTPERVALSAAFEVLLGQVAAHGDVVARLGTPVVVARSEPLSGTVRLDGDRGDADVQLEFNGPHGRAIVAAQADWNGRLWNLQRVDVQ